MIPLPPGCTVSYAVIIDISELTDAMCEWYDQIGGTIVVDSHYDHRGRKIELPYVSYNNSKRCHRRKDGTKGVRLHFLGKDAAVASLFLLKFNEYVEQHNLREHVDFQNA